MTIFTETARVPTNATFAGGEASLGDIAGATWDSLRYVENSNAAYQALNEALERRVSEIHGATGAQLANPLTQAEDEWRRLMTERPQSPFATTRRETRDEIYNRHLDRFRDELATLSEKFPDAREAIGAGRDPWDDAAQIARAADERLGLLMQSREGLGKYGALLAGGMAATLTDPVAVMSLAAGGGPGAARTIAGRILTVAGKEALINAASEAAIQPMVQDWRRRAGLEAGMDEAIRNVLFAGAIGGAFGAAGGAVAEVLSSSASRARRSGMAADDGRAAVAALDTSRLSEPARAILADDGLRAADSLAEIRAALPAEARGALDAAAAVKLADELKPASASPHGHDMALARADQAVRLGDIEAWPGFEPDAEQIERVTRAIAGDLNEAPAAPGTTRFYYGSADPNHNVRTQDELWVSPDPVYARDYRRGAKDNTLWYVDIPNDQLVHLGVRDEINGFNRIGKLPAKWARKARRLEEVNPGHQSRAETPLIDFLIARGGVQDFKGELKAIGAAEISERFRGRLVRENGQSLDYAREAAAEAGYFDHLYGDAETAVARSTVADLLDALEEDVRVRTSGGVAATTAEEAALGQLDGIVADIARMAGPAVDDAVIERAARLAVEDGLDPFDALERVLIADEGAGGGWQSAVRDGEPMPGWSDEELLAASEHRGAWPEPDGIDDPRVVSPEDADARELAELPDDFMVPGEDGQLVSAAALREEFERRETMIAVVEACRA